ncbi:MAG TPA: mechanosensitive ion channel domain-containing protein [Candidatus Sulfotelmatobacter sp.]|jgi:small-conductance mechanosensitive channel
MVFHLAEWRAFAFSAGEIATAFVVALLIHFILFRAARRFTLHKQTVLAHAVLHCEQPARLILLSLLELAVVPFLPGSVNFKAGLRHAIGLCLVGAVAWFLVALVDVVEAVLAYKYSMELAENIEARRVRTQVLVLRRLVVVVIIVMAIATMLMTFPSIRHIGESLFASAGLAAVVAGLAARTMLSNLFAGVQIALTQPIRLEDAVVVEGEWGWVEEITTTFVVVRIWDLRRLVLPISYFIEKPFQNWTRRNADLLGTVFLYTDYSAPVEELRQELHRILTSSGMWDGKAWGLQVTNATDRTLELRALMSAPNGSRAWDLRCLVRERLVQFLQQNYPESLPRTRADVQAVNARVGEDGTQHTSDLSSDSKSHSAKVA